MILNSSILSIEHQYSVNLWLWKKSVAVTVVRTNWHVLIAEKHQMTEEISETTPATYSASLLSICMLDMFQIVLNSPQYASISVHLTIPIGWSHWWVHIQSSVSVFYCCIYCRAKVHSRHLWEWATDGKLMLLLSLDLVMKGAASVFFVTSPKQDKWH